MKGKALAIMAVITLATSALAQQRVTSNENTTNKVTSSTSKKAEKVNLNTASQSELEALPGVGPGLAQAIISERPFKSVEGLKEVRGIGAARYEEIRPHVTVRSRPSSVGGPAAGSGGDPVHSGGDKPTSDAQERNKPAPGAKSSTKNSVKDPVHSGGDKPTSDAQERNRTPRKD